MVNNTSEINNPPLEDVDEDDITLEEVNAEEEAQAQIDREERVRQALIALAGQIEQKFTQRKSKRQIKERQWLTARAMYLGSVANENFGIADKPFKNGENVSYTPKFNIVGTRCDTAISVLWAKQFAGGDKNWEIRASEDPKDAEGNPIDPSMAADAAARMEYVIADQLAKGRYGYQCRLAMEDMVIEGTAVIKTPVNAASASIQYTTKTAENGATVALPIVKNVQYPCVKRINPWFFFPDETALSIESCTDAIVLHPMSKEELRKLKDNPMFFGDTIDAVLQSEPPEESTDSNYTFTQITDSSSEALRGKYRVLEYHGPMSRDMLMNFNIEPTYQTPEDIYFVEVWVVNNQIISIQLSNIEGIQTVPFAVSVWKPDPSSLFGIGLATQLADAQMVINKTYEMILDNAAISAGPQVILDKTKITPADGNWRLRPFKLWYNTEYDSDVTKAFAEFQPNSMAGPLMNLLQAVQNFAQEEAAVPFFLPGTQSAVTQPTAHGTAEIIDNSTTVIDFFNERWDDCITSKVIGGFYSWNMQYNNDPSIKGDFEIDVRSSSDIRSAKMHLMDLEKLAALSAQDPELGLIINKQALSKARLMAMRLPHKGIIRSDEEIQAEMEQRANQGPDPQMMEIQLKQQELAIKERELALKEQMLQFQMQKEMAQAQMDHQEKMGANAARLREADAQVLAKQLEYQVQLAQLAQKDELGREKIYADLKKLEMQEQTKKFLAGMSTTAQFQKIAAQKEEMDLKRQIGSGI